MTRIMLITGICLLVFGLAELAWSLRGKLPRLFALQGMMFAEMGAMFIVNRATHNGSVAVTVDAALGVGFAWTALAMFKLARKERRERAAPG